MIYGSNEFQNKQSFVNSLKAFMFYTKISATDIIGIFNGSEEEYEGFLNTDDLSMLSGDILDELLNLVESKMIPSSADYPYLFTSESIDYNVDFGNITHVRNIGKYIEGRLAEELISRGMMDQEGNRFENAISYVK